MQKKTSTVKWVVVGGVTMQAFMVPGIETANAHLMHPSKLAEVNLQRHLEGCSYRMVQSHSLGPSRQCGELSGS